MADRKTITQRIALEGGDGVRAQLVAIGKAGQDAFKKFQDAGGANAVIGSFGNTLDGIKNRIANVGVAARKMGDDFRNLGESVTRSGRNVLAAGAVFAGLIIGFGALTKGAADAGDAIAKTAESLGFSTKAYQELSFAAGQAGVSQQDFDSAQGKLARSLDQSVKSDLEAAKQKKALSREFGLGKISIEQYSEKLRDLNFQQSQQVDIYKRLGVQIAKNKDGTVDTVETELRLADAFHKSTDTQLKTSAALEIFGRGNQKMVVFLNQGRAAIEAQRKEAQRLGLVISDDVLKRQENLNDSFDRLGKAANSTRLNVLGVFSPTVTRVIDAIVEAMARWRAQLVVLATDIANKAVPIVDDFIALLEGRDKDIKNTFILQARDAVVAFGQATQQAVTGIIIPALKGLLAILNTVAGAINAVFGTSLSGQEIAIAVAVTKLIGLFGVLRAAVTVIVSTIGLLVATFGALPVILTAIGVALGFFLVQAVGGLKGLQDAWTKTWAAISSFVAREINGIAVIAGGLVSAFTAVVAGIVAVFSGLADALTTAFQAVVALAQSTWDAIVSAAVNIGTGIVTAFQTALSAVGGFFKGMFDGAVSLLKQLLDFATKVANAVKAAFGGGNTTAPAGQGAAPGFAGGGAVYGPGSTTSDSILARLSNHEYVHNARATGYYGTRFMDALNQMRIPIDAVRALMGSGFNLGGIVDRMGGIMPHGMVPHFADGGLVAAGDAGFGGAALHPVTLVINGQSTSGLLAPSDVVSALNKATRREMLTSTGRKPPWAYYGRL